MTKNNWLKNCLGYSNNKYETEEGNGKKIKEYTQKKEIKYWLNDKNKPIIITKTEPKLDEEGKQCYKNLYEDIQDMKDSVDLEKILSNNMSFDQIQLKIAQNQKLFQPTTPEYSGDFSDFATVEKLQQIKNDANLNGKNYNEFVKNSNQVINKYNNLIKQNEILKKQLSEKNKFDNYLKNQKKMEEKK